MTKGDGWDHARKLAGRIGMDPTDSPPLNRERPLATATRPAQAKTQDGAKRPPNSPGGTRIAARKR